MIELTVKTLDSQNHAFTVDDDMTVAQFKEKIADTVNIPADTQRIIYCGRVLQDSSKLIEYDVNGKVVHLVQRPPPSTNARPNQQSESPPTQPQIHRRIRGLEYLGSLRLPPPTVNDQNIMPPLPTHTLAASRLNVARRMLRRAESVLNTLENPTARPADQPTQEVQAEMTPVFEARVMVPNIPSNESLNEAAVISAVNSLMNSALRPINGTPATVTPNIQVQLADSLPTTTVTNDAEIQHSVSSTPEVTSPLATSSENLNTQDEDQGNGASNEDETTTSNDNNAANTANTSNDTISRTSEYAELLENLSRIHSRFTPFLDEYYNFMRDDPTVSSENARTVQATINRVSEILHLLGHAYHSLSDIIVRVRTPPPRPLLCRPILLQHSAIVQAGIPIQVEAQINFSSDRNGNGNRPATTQPSTTNGNQTSSTTTAANNIVHTITSQLPSRVVDFPFLSGSGVRVETYHIPQTANMNMENSNAPTNNNNRDTPAAMEGNPNLVQVTSDNAILNNESGLTFGIDNTNNDAAVGDSTNISNLFITSNLMNNGGNNTSEANQQVTNSTTTSTTPQVTMNNPVEIFMEVTPESITIDSLETAFVGSNQANEILQGTLNPPPELIQSIMHMAGQLINRGAQSTTVVSASNTPNVSQPDTSATDSQAAISTNGGAARVIPFQNSQARGNTQTQPTTATHTRSTARPHVHLAQHAMQGFDPFLPCNSHHVQRRRQPNIVHPANQNQTGATTAQPNGEVSNEPRNTDPSHPLYNIMRSIINSVHHAYTNQTGPHTPPDNTTSTAQNVTSAPNASQPSVNPPWMPTLENMNLSDTHNLLRNPTPTIAQLLQQFPDESYTEGESIFTDLIMLLSRNLSVADVVQINSGRLEPLMRIRNQLRNFFLYRILDGCQGSAAIERGVDRLLNELQPLLNNLSTLETRDDIDIVRSVQTLLRARLPNIISLVASRSPNSLKMVIDQIRTTGRQFCALVVRASQNGRQGVESVFDLILSRYMEGIPRDLQQWTLMTSRAHIILVLSSLDVPESILQPYIVREVDAITPSILTESVTSQGSNASDHVEVMQVDEEVQNVNTTAAEEPSLPVINLADDSEPLPQVVFGSETWHGQVPSDWVPIIARDTQRQRRQNSQPPFSDAYLSGMPSKRRKIVANSKPQGSLPQVITDSVRHAVTATGLTAVAPVETIAEAAGADLNVQSAYRNLLRSSVQSNLSNNEDFTPERFPNANNYFINYPQ